jgi:hypothetical protein
MSAEQVPHQRNCVAAKWIQAEESCECRSENLKFRHQTIGWMESVATR